jgi:hypothetical protein
MFKIMFPWKAGPVRGMCVAWSWPGPWSTALSPMNCATHAWLSLLSLGAGENRAIEKREIPATPTPPRGSIPVVLDPTRVTGDAVHANDRHSVELIRHTVPRTAVARASCGQARWAAMRGVEFGDHCVGLTRNRIQAANYGAHRSAGRIAPPSAHLPEKKRKLRDCHPTACLLAPAIRRLESRRRRARNAIAIATLG